LDPKEISELNVEIKGQLIEASGIERGKRQGDALSTTLFNNVMDKTIRNIETNPKETIFNRMIQYIAYADSFDILSVFGRSINTDEGRCSKHWIGDKQKQNKIHENKQKYNKFRARSNNEWTCI